MNRKKLIALGLAVLLVLSLAACGTKDNGKEAECDGNSIVVAPFDYGTSLGCRVAKVVFVK